jgi:hypothetical protein
MEAHRIANGQPADGGLADASIRRRSFCSTSPVLE